MTINLNRLLALDDNPSVLAMVRRIAERAGYAMAGACSVADFKREFIAARPTLIVLDLVVGEEDCTRALEFLAQCRSEVPLVLMTGHEPGYLEVAGTIASRFGQRIVERVEKRRTLFLLEDLLAQYRIPDIALDASLALQEQVR